MRTLPLVETTRGLSRAQASVENVHQGAVAVVDVSGRVLSSAGDPHLTVFTRSALKPLQALPLIEDGGLRQLGFGAAELALFCASHSGEPRHVERVAAILARLELSEADLQCGCQVPTFYATTGQTPPVGALFNQLHHNCSGKHSGMLAWCRLHGVAHADYLAFDHVLQARIRERLLATLALDAGQVRVGIDGCSAPNYALPLSTLAQFYARLARYEDAGAHSAAFGAIFAAMTGHPELVSGIGRNDLAYMQAASGDWISKAGADGVQVVASRVQGIAVAVKIADGNTRALHTAVVEALEQSGLASTATRAHTARWARPAIRNYRGIEVGEVRPCFRLEPAK